MNRKLLNGLLVASLAIGSAMSVTSCKDTDEDLYAQLRDENATLDQKVNADIEALKTAQKALEEAQKKCQQDCDAKWKECLLKKDFEKTLNDYVKSAGRNETLLWYLAQINSALTKANPDGTNTEYNTIGERFVALETALAALNNTNITEIPGLDEVAQWLKDHDNQTLPQVLQKAINADKQANENLAILQALLKGYENADGTFDLTKIQGLMKQAVDDAAAAKATADEAKSKATTAAATANTAKEAADKATAAVATLTTRVETVEKKIEKITAQLDAMTGKLNHLITSIEIQQVKNPVFGKMNLPLDVNSKMLVSYFGEASNVNFPPVNSSATEYNNNLVISAADQNLLGISTENFNGYLGAEDGNLKLGSVYMTVNPAGVDLEGAKFEMVNSQGVASSVKLSELVKSDEVLKFGFGGRAADPTLPSLYVADATLPVADIDKIKLTLGGNFESEVEDLLKNHTLSDLAQVAKLIYGQFNNKIEATGVKAGWEYEQAILDEEGNPTGETETIKDATFSEFGLAATTFKPLSYKFLYGRHFKPLPTISPIEDFTLDSKLTITMPEFNFNFDDVNLGFSFGDITVDIPDGTVIEVKIPETNVYKVVNGVQTSEIIGVIKEQTVKATDFTSLEGALSTAISNALQTQNEAINDAFKKAIGEVAKKINSQINTEMDKLKTNIETQFNNIVTEIQNKVNGYLGTVNNYIDKANSFLNRINRFIEDPNHYLQVTMLYSANDGAFHQVSNSSVAPTTLELNGGDGITLHPTSYTYDMIAPSFKKYVAVTKVYDNKTGVTNEALTKAANDKAGLLNTVFPGNYTDVALKLTKGYTYEIVYSSLDYHGVTSTRKFYIMVK